MTRHIVTGSWFLSLAFLLSVLPRLAVAVPASPGYDPPYEVQVVVNGVPVAEYRHDGRYFVEGRKGQRYALRLINRTGHRVEVVATVDGLDVIDGKPGDYVRKRGYVLGPWQTYDVEGFRLDMGRVAAFRFSPVANSYAAQTGSARNVGVIGVAFFEERRPTPVRRPPRPIRPQYGYGGGGSGGYGRMGGWDDGDAAAEASPADESVTAGAKTRTESAVGAMRGGPAASAPAPAMDGLVQREAGEAKRRPGLGTEFGESRHSEVGETTFVRAHSATPTRIVTLRYDDRAGLRAQGVPVDPPPPSDTWLRATADPFPATPPRRFAQPPAGWDD